MYSVLICASNGGSWKNGGDEPFPFRFGFIDILTTQEWICKLFKMNLITAIETDIWIYGM